MRGLKKKGIISYLLICSLLMSQLTYVKAEEVSDADVTSISNSLRLQDDFYDATNKQWLNNATLDAGKVSNSTFMEANKKLTQQKKEIIKELLENEKSYSENSDERKIINLYKNDMNTEARNKEGIEPIKKMLNKIKNIKTLNDITNLNDDLEIENPLIQFVCDADLKDATKYALYIAPTDLSLGDSDEYIKPRENTERIKGLVENYYKNLLTLTGYDSEEAKVKVDNLFKFENMLASSITGQEENSKNEKAIDNEYNVYTLNEIDASAPNLKLKTIMKDLKIDKANKIILMQPKWLKVLNDIYIEDNLPIIKDYIEIVNINRAAAYLGEDFEKATTEFSNSYLGAEGDIPKDEKAINMVNSALGMPFGKIYIEKYFTDKTKVDVEKITDEVIKTYEKRINNLDWMSQTTKKSAIEKLNKLNFQIGYPSKWDDYSKLEIKSYEEGGSLWENIISLTKFMEEKSLNKLNKNVDKSEFACSPQTINAFYQSTSNTITVPAGILQGEFYNPDASKEKNMGAIGAIIGHEISHAFDNNGAKFDGDGNLNSWWTEEDYKKFEEKTNKVRKFYNQVKLDNGKNVNGDLTVGENIADIGGVACALDIVEQIPNPNYKEFFESNATIWREVNSKEYGDYRLQYDAHSPNKVRTNIVLAQFDKFYDTYEVKENDKMYIKPQDRLQIW